jgi:hypothetical protein
MAIDARLREGLHRSMSAIETDPDSHLADARRRGRRRVMIRWTASVIAVATTVVIVTVVAPGVMDLLRDQRHQPAEAPTLLPIAGTYTATISKRDAHGDERSAGTWLLTLDRDGTLDLASLTNGDIGRSITQYQIGSGRFLTTAFSGTTCSGVGHYVWSRSGSTLTFAVVSDPCALRVAIFSSQPWKST